jgi:hypothetical protein
VEQHVHLFDDARARRFLPRDGVEKIAVLVRTTDPDAETEIDTTFGRQRLRGAFYAVADGNASYGAARREFEATHRSIGPNRWVKSAPVLAYRAAEPHLVETVIDDHVEGTVRARPGDWIVRQHTGEVMVIDDDAFSMRYVAESAGAAST